MSLYQNFIGIDIGKFNFVAAIHGTKETKEYENNPSGIKSFINDYKKQLPKSLIVLETTGGHEMLVLLSLDDKKYQVHRANTRKVKNFIRSFSNGAKNDSLDAKALAFYGFERHKQLELFVPVSCKLYSLYELVGRRKDLNKILVAEKNRLKSPMKVGLIKESYEAFITFTAHQIKLVTKQIDELIKKDDVLASRQKILQTIPGIGEITSQNLLAMLPELGTLDRREVASLAGLAPKANDSGRFHGYRSTGYGRDGIKTTLFVAAMAARNSNSELKVFYTNLICRGKKKMVALTALMRKIIVIANAKIRDLMRQSEAIKI